MIQPLRRYEMQPTRTCHPRITVEWIARTVTYFLVRWGYMALAVGYWGRAQDCHCAGKPS
jgi:hypothetical protein